MDAEMVRLGPCLQGAHALIKLQGKKNVCVSHTPQSSYVISPYSLSVPSWYGLFLRIELVV